MTDADRCIDAAAAAAAANPASDDVAAADVNLSPTELHTPPSRPSRQLRRFDSLPRYDVTGHVVLSSTRLVEKLTATLNALTVDCRQQPGARNHDNGVDVTSRRHDSDTAALHSGSTTEYGDDEPTPEMVGTEPDVYESVMSSNQTDHEVNVEVERLAELDRPTPAVSKSVSDWMDSRQSVTSPAADRRTDGSDSDLTTTMTTLDVVLDKGPLGLGFCIDGGRDAPDGPSPITVKRLFKGSLRPSSIVVVVVS